MAKKTEASNAEAQPSAYAIVETSGQQFWLQKDRYYDIDRLKANVDETLTLENVLLVNDGEKTTLGKPYVKGASVELKVLAHRRGPKLIVYKMRPKKKTRRKNGHRQELTRVMVKEISMGSKSTSSQTKTSSSGTKKTSTAAPKTTSAKKSTAAKAPTKSSS